MLMGGGQLLEFRLRLPVLLMGGTQLLEWRQRLLVDELLANTLKVFGELAVSFVNNSLQVIDALVRRRCITLQVVHFYLNVSLGNDCLFHVIATLLEMPLTICTDLHLLLEHMVDILQLSWQISELT